MVSLRTDELKYIKEEIIEFWSTHKNTLKVNVSGIYDPELFELGLLDSLPSCLCGEYKATIDHLGRIFPCESMPFLDVNWDKFDAFGDPPSLTQMDINSALETPLFENWRNVLKARPMACSSCSYRLYCSSGCRAVGFINEASLNARDAGCHL